ncbi:unnamed protein product, partial [Ectocarpus sp. 12 AP-2014]
AIASRNASSITLGGTLAVRAVITCTSSYAFTEDDVNALEVSSAASVTASDVSGNAVDATDATIVSLDQEGSVRLVITASYPKTATPLEAAATSDVVSY